MLASRPYFETLYEAIADIVAHNDELSSPYLQAATGGRPLYVVIAGDRGLAGGYNSNIIKQCLSAMESQDVLVLPIGKKATEYFKTKGYALFTEEMTEAEDISASHCFSLAKQICSAFLDGTVSQVHIGYTNFVSVLSQTPALLQALPLPGQNTAGQVSGSQILYEPDAETVFETIVPEYVGGILYGALCESRAAEQAARRTAMDAATQNADDMIAELNLKYNQARQAAITQEITEIVAGSNA
jgi:F-type H+-transporting ATPase subunit gamma